MLVDHTWALCIGIWRLSNAEMGATPSKVEGLEAIGSGAWPIDLGCLAFRRLGRGVGSPDTGCALEGQADVCCIS